MNDQLRALLAEAIRDASLYSGDIPAIDLYLDQIMSLLSHAQEKGAPHFAERQLTKTMINNYSKDGLIMPVKGKKYTKEHIVQMMLVYSLKNTLSMTEIKQILSDLYQKDVSLLDCYDTYLAAKLQDRELCMNAAEAVISRPECDMERDEDYFTVLMELCRLSDYFRCMAQAMLQARYPGPEEQLQQEREEKQQKKAAKDAAKQQKKIAKEALAAEGENA